jgi:hypothetical protein
VSLRPLVRSFVWQTFYRNWCFEKEGAGLFGDSNDTTAYIPVNFVRQLYGDNNDSLTNAIIIKPEKE